MKTWIYWHLMKISESIDAHRREKNMQKSTWRKNDTKGSHSFTQSAPPICEVWHIIAGRVGNECLCHSSFYESEALTHTHTHTHTALSIATTRLQCPQIIQELHSPEPSTFPPRSRYIMTRLRAGRSVVRIPTAERNFSLFPNVQTGSGAFRDFANAPKRDGGLVPSISVVCGWGVSFRWGVSVNKWSDVKCSDEGWTDEIYVKCFQSEV